jgi:hypothetical protein
MKYQNHHGGSIYWNNIVQFEIVICNILFFFNLVTVKKTAHTILDTEDIVVHGVEIFGEDIAR